MGIVKAIKRLLYPPRCVFCRAALGDNEADGICARCRVELPYTGSRARSRGEFFSGCVSPLYYAGAAAEAVRRFKFSGRVSYARVMGKMIGECAAEHYSDTCELITWVPVSGRRYRTRGYSQAELLAREVAEAMGLPARRLLRKSRHTPPQSTLKGYAARKANVSGAFAAVNEEEIKGRRILLVDDVFTTGATVSECSRILLMAGAQSVCCAALCRAKNREELKKQAASAGGRP